MDLKKHITNIETLEQDLRAIADPSGHLRDAIIRCVTLKRALTQHLDLQAGAAAVINEAKAGLKAALGPKTQ